MGNVGGIEKILVGCILVIILAILGIAVSSTNEPSEPPYQKIASKPERTQDPAHRSKKSDGASPLMGGPTSVDGKTGGDAGEVLEPRRVRPTAKQENREPTDVTDRTNPPTPPVNANADDVSDAGKSVAANPEKPKADPSATNEPTKTAPQSKTTGTPKFHVVVKGDTVEKIAMQYFDDRRMADEILKLNEDLEPTRLFEGRKVLLPDAKIKDLLAVADAAKSNAANPATAPAKAPEEPALASGKYRVKKGDTILSICRDHYGNVARWQEVLKANGMKEGRDLRVGMELTLP